MCYKFGAEFKNAAPEIFMAPPTHPAPQPKYHENLSSARGEIPGTSLYAKYGYNSNIGTTYEPIWDGTTAYPGWLTTASTVRVRSGGNLYDTLAGSGAQKVTIAGLDENWEPAEEEVELAGTSASAATTITFIRVNRVYVTQAGTARGNNTGTITIEDTGTTSALAAIVSGNGQTLMALMTVPAGKTAYVRHITIIPDSNKRMDVQFWAVESADVSTSSARLKRFWPALNQVHTEMADSLPSFPEKTDLWFEAKASGSGNGLAVRGDIWLVDN